MRKIILFFLSFIALSGSFAQTGTHIKPGVIGVHFLYDDFVTAAEIRATTLGDVLRAKKWANTNRMSSGFAISYTKGFSDYIDISSSVAFSSVAYPVPGKTITDKSLLIEAVSTGNLKLTTDKYWVSPFLTLGIGASKYKGYFGAVVPMGIGLQVNLGKAFVLINSQYRYPVTENMAYHFYHSVGVAYNVFRCKKK